jgi:hypothetical protein
MMKVNDFSNFLASAIWAKNCSTQTGLEIAVTTRFLSRVAPRARHIPFVGGSRTARISLFHGELVKKVTACILFILLGQAISFPVFARADTNSAQRKPQASLMKKYMKHQKKEHKNARKSQRKAEKNWKMRHHTGH